MPVDHADALESLADRRKHIELVAVRQPPDDTGLLAATVFVPEKAREFLGTKIDQYRDQETPKGRPQNENLVARLEDVHLGTCRSLFTDDLGLYPAGVDAIWWEVWVREGKLATFRAVAGRLGLLVKDHTITFPERDVILANASEPDMARLVLNTDAVAELRIAKDTPRLFLEMKAVEQAAWAKDLARRVVLPHDEAPAVCLLDSGATQAHPLLAASLHPQDQHAYDAAWGVADSEYWNGHGTQMGGMALYGDLEAALARSGAVTLTHRLETVKILPPAGQNEPHLYGAVTRVGIERAETRDPRRLRVFCMAVTSGVGLARGRPSSWSAAVDQLAYGDGARRRLFVLATGNLRDEIQAGGYPDRNDLEEVENPAQAWNALVAGAYTEKTTITDPSFRGWVAVAPAGDLTPSSRTSVTWERKWPVRPDVVFEGGNMAHDGQNAAVLLDDLQLVTTHYRPQVRLYDSFGDTSAATALAANMAAGIMAVRPELWPETVRGLIVQSAEWTPAMRGRFATETSKTAKLSLLRRYGWGVPDLERALRSAANDATLMVQDTMLPLRREGSAIKSGNMNVHNLPWPRDELLALGDMAVELRVTLSYFIEPNPGERGWGQPHGYASHSFRFAVKRALEGLAQFRKRINKAAATEEAGDASSAGGDEWVLGPIRDRGSLHSDIWHGTAAALAERDAVGVYPVGGWWKVKPALQRWDRSTRYALIVSLRAPEAEVDLYSVIQTKLEQVVPAS